MWFVWAASEFFEAMESASVLHILILVYLRLLAIRKPLSRDNHIIRLRRKLIILIWTISFSVEIFGFLCGYFWTPISYEIADIFQLFVLEVAPLIFIILTNCLIVKTLQKKMHETNISDLMLTNNSYAISNYDRSTKMVKILVYFLIFTVTPYLIFRAVGLIWVVICESSICDLEITKVTTF